MSWGTGINVAKPTDADKAALGAVLFYNIIAAAGSSAPTTGQPAALLKKGSLQSALGLATAANLPLTFTQSCPTCLVCPTPSLGPRPIL